MKLLICTTAGMLVAAQAMAGTCDYRPSQLMGGEMTGIVGASGASVAAASAGAKAAGFYTLTHSVTGLTMLGSTAGGASAAGTVGIMGGTGGLIGATAAALMAPITLVIAGGAAVAVGAYEGSCYFMDERITDEDEVLKVMQVLAEGAGPDNFRLITDTLEPDRIALRPTIAGEWQTYEVANLYIVNGILKHRDWGRNTVIGPITYVSEK